MKGSYKGSSKKSPRKRINKEKRQLLWLNMVQAPLKVTCNQQEATIKEEKEITTIAHIKKRRE